MTTSRRRSVHRRRAAIALGIGSQEAQSRVSGLSFVSSVLRGIRKQSCPLALPMRPYVLKKMSLPFVLYYSRLRAPSVVRSRRRDCRSISIMHIRFPCVRDAESGTLLTTFCDKKNLATSSGHTFFLFAVCAVLCVAA